MERNSKTDIAIIGVSGKFPNSKNIEEFWDNLVKGEELLKFYSDSELYDLGIAKNIIEDSSYIKVDSKIDKSGSFDFGFFGYTYDEAMMMDPQVRLFHEYCWIALEDAGYDPFLYPDKIGLYATASDNFNWRVNTMFSKEHTVSPFLLSQISNKNFLSTLVSYKLNLRGPSYNIDTACSSSLSAIHIACRNLLLKECSLAIAGGVSLSSKASIGYHYEEGMINSIDGHCRAFDHRSSGVIAGEGIGVVVLKRLADAIESRDNIYAVIKSSAVNNDGKIKIGYTAPSVQGQVDCIRSALGAGKISPSSVSYIETHGTGTVIGDPIEIDALNLAYGMQDKKCPIGSVKNNLGHLDAASGITGLIKTILSLKNKKIPPTINFERPNPKINFKNGPFYVNTELKVWESNFEPLRAGVSSFGIGGTNCHVILEEFPNLEKINKEKPYKLIRFSAKSLTSLENYTDKFLKYLNDNEDVSMADTAYTLQTGRKDFENMRFFSCTDRNDAILKLQSGKDIKDRQCIKKNGLVFMFPGQGSQYTGMCRDLYEQESYIRDIFDEGFEILKSLSNINYKNILFEGFNIEKNAGNINETIYSQPLLFLAEYALGKFFIHIGVIPQYLIGHSIGEYSAACLAGLLSFKAALELVYRRACLINLVEPGSMLAVSLSKNKVAPFLNDEISLAAINSEDITVLSGTKFAIEKLILELEAQKITYLKLAAEHAFHSVMMEKISDDFKKVLEKVQFFDTQIPIVSNLSGCIILSEELKSADYWLKHLKETVDFSGGISTLLQNENLIYIEVGPGKVLTNLLKKTLKLRTDSIALNTVRLPNQIIDDNNILLEFIGELWTNGININWDVYYGDQKRFRISAPTYAFDEYLFPVSKNISETLELYDLKNTSKEKRSLSQWFYLPSWKRSFIIKQDTAIIDSNKFLFFSDNSEMCNSLIQALFKESREIIVITQGTGYNKKSDFEYEINPQIDNDYIAVYRDIFANNIIEQIVFGWGLSITELNIERSDFENRFNQVNIVFFKLLKILQNFKIQEYSQKVKITILSNVNQEVIYTDKLHYNCSTALSLLKVAALENPNIFPCNIDINPEVKDKDLCQAILNDIKYNFTDEMIAYRSNQRWSKYYENITLGKPENSRIKNNGVYLISGGLGEVGLAFVEYLYNTYKANLIVLGRTELPPADQWDNIINDSQYDEKMLEKIKKINRLGKNFSYYQCDIADYNSLSSAVELIEKQHGSIDGIIHAAGIVDENTFKAIENIDKDIVKRQFKPKMNGLLNLYTIFGSKEIDFVWITSSLSSILGGLTYAPYAGANSFMDAFVNSNRLKLPNWFCINLDAIGKGDKNAINLQDLMEIFERSFQIKENPQLIISIKDIASRVKKRNQIVQKKDFISQRPILKNNYKAPVTETEMNLQKIWQDFFKISNIGMKDDFFDLGGDSLKAITIIKRISKIFNIEIGIHSFYGKPNIEDLANEIDIALNIALMKEKKLSNSSLNEFKI